MMLIKELYTSLRIIESAVLGSPQDDIKTCDKIIMNEIKKVQQQIDDTFIHEMIFGIYHHWKIYSGQKIEDGFIAKRYQELDHIMIDCGRIKSYAAKYLGDEKKD